MSTFELNISDRSRVDLVVRFWLAERSDGRAAGECQREQHRAYSHLLFHQFRALVTRARRGRELGHEWRLEVAK